MTGSLDDFAQRNAQEWATAVASLGLGAPESTSWNDPAAMVDVLRPFMGRNRNHALLPTGGGMDWHSIGSSKEAGCLEAEDSERSADVFKPRLLTFQPFPEDLTQSFLLLELDRLAPSGVYEDARDREELVDLPGKGYVDRWVWDAGYIGHDEHGQEIPLPEGARLISRWLGGKVLIAAKSSIWNSIPDTYHAPHNTMTAEQIRDSIARVLARGGRS